MRYIYSLLRYVPDPIRGEFVNIGVIVGGQDVTDWRVRRVASLKRARALGESGSVNAAKDLVDRIALFVERARQGQDVLLSDPEQRFDVPSEVWLQGLCHRHRNILQISPPTPVVGATADDAMDTVFSWIAPEMSRQSRDYETKTSVFARVLRAYERESIHRGSNLYDHVTLQAEHHSERIDYAVVNGRPVQLTQTWSFQIPDVEEVVEAVKAWAWTIRAVRQRGGIISWAKDREYTVDRNIDIEVVYVPPKPSQRYPVVAEASSIFRELGVRYASDDRADGVSIKARQLLAA